MNGKKLVRSFFNELEEWNSSNIRSPLLLMGARQVGKTTILKDFAHQIASRVIEVNFWRDRKNILKNIFNSSGDAFEILEELKDLNSLESIDLDKDVLLIDEVQECPAAYSSLKSFKEQIPQLRVLVTGSYLQLFLKNRDLQSLPVGCVDEFQLRPLSFVEFLQNADPGLYTKYNSLRTDQFKCTEALHQKLMNKLFEYFFTGGLPEIVFLYLSEKPSSALRKKVRKKQKDLLKQYTLDFQKYGKSAHIQKIDKLFQSIPFQLEQEKEETVQRFFYKDLGKNANYSKFHWSFDYLEQAGLIIRSYFVSKKEFPLRVHEKMELRNIFKCFFFDVGLLNAFLNTPVDFAFHKLGSYKGYLAENFVAQELSLIPNQHLISYKKNSKSDAAEVEFILSTEDGELIPIEVKSSLKALKAKSLIHFVKEFSPLKSYKLVPVKDHQEEGIISLPLYMISRIHP